MHINMTVKLLKMTNKRHTDTDKSVLVNRRVREWRSAKEGKRDKRGHKMTERQLWVMSTQCDIQMMCHRIVPMKPVSSHGPMSPQ